MANEKKQCADDPVMTNTTSADETTSTHARVLCAEGLLEKFAIAETPTVLGIDSSGCVSRPKSIGYLIQSRIRIECVPGSIKRIR